MNRGAQRVHRAAPGLGAQYRQEPPGLHRGLKRAILHLQDSDADQARQRAELPVTEGSGHPDGLVQIMAGGDLIAEAHLQQAEVVAGQDLPAQVA